MAKKRKKYRRSFAAMNTAPEKGETRTKVAPPRKTKKRSGAKPKTSDLGKLNLADELMRLDTFQECLKWLAKEDFADAELKKFARQQSRRAKKRARQLRKIEALLSKAEALLH